MVVGFICQILINLNQRRFDYDRDVQEKFKAFALVIRLALKGSL